jgi:hypothetical protein
MKRRIHRIQILAGSALAALTLSFVSASTAQAIPSQCNWGNEGSSSWASCTGGNGQFQAWAQCKPKYPWITNWYTSYGTWRSPAPYPGPVSVAGCDGNHQVGSYGISYR